MEALLKSTTTDLTKTNTDCYGVIQWNCIDKG